MTNACMTCAFALPARLPFCPRCGGLARGSTLAEVVLGRWETLEQLVVNQVWDGRVGGGYLQGPIDALRALDETNLPADPIVLAARRRAVAVFERVCHEPDLATRHTLLQLFCHWLPPADAPKLHDHLQRIKKFIPALQAGAKQAAEGKLPTAAAEWLDHLAHEHALDAVDVRRSVFATPNYWSKFAQAVDPEQFALSRSALLVGYAYTALTAKNYSQAAAHLQEAAKLAPDDARVPVAIADLHVAQERAAESIPACRRAFELGTTNVRILNNLAWFESTLELGRDRDLDLALLAARRAAGLAPVASVLDTLAEVHYRRGELELAYAAAAAAVRDQPDNDKYVARLDALASDIGRQFAALDRLTTTGNRSTTHDDTPSAVFMEADEDTVVSFSADFQEPVALDDEALAIPELDDEELALAEPDEPTAVLPKPHPATPAPPVAPATDDDSLIDIFDHPPELKSVSATDPGDFSHAPRVQRDTVDCSAFGPVAAVPGESFLVQVMVHPPEQDAQARQLALESDPGAQRRGRTSLATQIARGEQLNFEFSCKGAEVDEHFQSIVWRGLIQNVNFFVTPGPDARTSLPVKITVMQGQTPIGQIRFIVNCLPGVPSPPEKKLVGEAVRYRTAFASYASPDRAAVLQRVQMLRMVGISCFQDVLDLEPGQRWEQQLWKHIDEADVLFLFWSQNAKSSKWVTEEWRYGLKQHGLDFIRPVILQHKPFVEPPPELAELHFNDRVMNMLDNN